MRASMFTPWVRWSARQDLKGLAFPGVYVLGHLARSLEGRSFSWLEETVYVGMTNSKGGLRARLQQFDDTIAGKRVSHGGADRVRYRHRRYSRFLATFYVSACAIPCDVKTSRLTDLLKMGEVAKLEHECFAAYARRFGRLPQFNDRARARKLSKSVDRKT